MVAVTTFTCQLHRVLEVQLGKCVPITTPCPSAVVKKKKKKIKRICAFNYYAELKKEFVPMNN